jgi:hypothetical protein
VTLSICPYIGIYEEGASTAVTLSAPARAAIMDSRPLQAAGRQGDDDWGIPDGDPRAFALYVCVVRVDSRILGECG